METITIKKTHKGIWMKRFDDYETSFNRISKTEALDSIDKARKEGLMIVDGDENSTKMEIFGYYN